MMSQKNSHLFYCLLIMLFSFSFLMGEGYELNQRINQHSYPKLFVQIQDYIPTETVIKEAASWDLLVLDAEVSANNPGYLGENGTIRSINPYAAIVFYFSAADLLPNNTATINGGFIAGLEDGWYMKDINGDHVVLFEIYDGYWSEMLNLSTGVNAYMPTYLNNTVISTGLGDGIFYDWINEEVSWINHDAGNPSAAIDIDNDGTADSDNKIDSTWQQGTTTLLTNTGNTFPAGTLITGNGGWAFNDTYANVMNGRMMEDFLGGDSPGIQGYGWHDIMRGHYLMHLVSLEPKMSMIMANGDQKDFQFMRFALCSALMFDGYYCYTNEGTYLSTRWYDEYSVNIYTGKAVKSLSCKGYLGDPSSDAYDVDNNSTLLKNLLLNDNDSSEQKVWRRDFENGIVLVNPSTSAKTVNLNDSFRKISGIYDPAFNDGSTVNSVALPSQSGIVLLNKASGSAPVISVSRSQMYFGAVSGGQATGSQSFLVSNSGGGTLSWTCSDNSQWLSCSPTGGSSGDMVTAAVDSSGLAVGTHTASITISDPKASNSPQTVNVTLTIYRSGSTAIPFGDFATPLDGATVRSSIPVTGWVLDDIEVVSLKIYNGQTYIGDGVFVEGPRPDVEQAYPTYPKSYQAGWGYMLLTNFLPNGGNGTYTLIAKATDTEGHTVTLGSKTITIDNANAIKPFGAIDTPGQGGTATGSSFINWGWVLTPQPNTIPTDGSTINVYVDGVNIGHPVYNLYRSDIASLFPGYNNTDGASGKFILDTTAYSNGIHTIQWTAKDDGGNSDGIGSRYFSVQNASTSSAYNKSSYRTSQISQPEPIASISNSIVESVEGIKLIKGFDQNSEPEMFYPDGDGNINVAIEELDRVVIFLNDDQQGPYHGYMSVGGISKPLPPGSTLDTKQGIFYWCPGPGFIGNYELVFTNGYNNGIKRVLIKILPKFSLNPLPNS